MHFPFFVPASALLLFGTMIMQDMITTRSASSPRTATITAGKMSSSREPFSLLRNLPEKTLPETPSPDKNVPAPSSDLPLPGTMTSEEYEKLLYPFIQNREYKQPGWKVDKGVRDTGPFIGDIMYGTHDAVRIWYSPDVITWLENNREGSIPDGSMIVKEMFRPPAARHDNMTERQIDSAIQGWTIMVRDSSASKDGWYWSYYGPGQPIDNPALHPFDYPNSGFGQYCVRCHASAENEFTFSSLTNIKGYPGEPVLFRVDDSWLPSYPQVHPIRSSHKIRADADVPGESREEEGEGTRSLNNEFVEFFDQMKVMPGHEVATLPSASYDHVIVGPGGPEQFITSDQCLSCHDGQALPFGPNMYVPSHDGKNVNLSPYGEWSWSMMGLAGRDPIFYAQLESEIRYYPDRAAEIQDLCFSCHGVMGQRQLHIDHPNRRFNEHIPYIKDQNDSLFKYGALARDGISCTVCHQIVDDKLPLDSIVTGRFKVSTPGEFEEGISYIYGPFEDPRILAMESSLGMKPVHNEYITSSRLCGSCHSVKLPVYNDKGKQVGEVFEQATYLEWQNSAYQDEFGSGGATPKTCQNCHMPTTYPYLPDDYQGAEKAQPLAFRIANIQDQTYPQVEHRAPIDSVTINIRADFVRHTLLGINIFGLEMFRQFDDILGVRIQDYMTGSQNGLPFAIETAQRLATQHTARVDITKLEKTGKGLRATVKVTNLAGHRFPSGVGFRRAFLEFKVIDQMNEVIWASGRTNELGIIMDGKGEPLPSEFLEVDPHTGQQQYEPHYQKITRQDQVQIYQELAKNTDGKFTTSFLGIYKHVKDNRLLPIGWTPKGPPGFQYAKETMPHGKATTDPDFINGTGSDIIVYEVELPPSAMEKATVSATLYYQSIPPYYLRDRFTTAPDGRATQRLFYLASYLQTEGTPINNWKLLIRGATQRIGE